MRHPEHSLRIAVAICLATAGLLGLAACGQQGPKSKSQVIAQVNGQELTRIQLAPLLPAGPDAGPQAMRQAVDALIDEELLVQDALNNKLDRDPGVVQAFEHARRRILAQTYLERMIFPKTPVTLSELQNYYKQNPDLFENRKTYKLTVFTLPAGDMSKTLRTGIEGAHSADQVRTLLEAQGLKFETQLRESSAEQLPTGLLPRFATSAVGDTLVANQKDGRTLLIVVNGIEHSPVPFERARPAIEQYLVSARNARALQDHLKQARATAAIAHSQNDDKSGGEQPHGPS